MPIRVSAVVSLVRRAGGRMVRRLGLVPAGDPDGLGEDARLGDAVLEQKVVAFFPEPPRNAYQLEQWLSPLEALDERHSVVIVTQDSRTTARLRDRTSLPVLCVARSATLEGLVARSPIALALYVSHHPRNFQMLRFADVAHVYLGHGESDKAVSASNQVKAYDRTFVAGPAAEERLLEQLMWFGRDRVVQIGRPQAGAPSRREPGYPPTVLYAPTWEGAQPSMAYCSVRTHGPGLVRSLQAAGARVIYRPHPRTGANRRDIADADAALRRLVEQSPSAVVQIDTALQAAFAEADLLVTDVSSVAVEWLSTGRPLMVTVPAEPGATVARSRLLDEVPRLTAEAAPACTDFLLRCLRDVPDTQQRAALIDHYLGGSSGSAALARFVDACTDVLAAREAAPDGESEDPMITIDRPQRPTIDELRDVTQPPAIRGRRTAEHWTGDLYMRSVSPYLTRMLIRAGLSANAVTALMILSGAASGFALLVPGLTGALLAVLLTQLQMLWDACDGEVARWRGSCSPMGIFLDRVGHYTTEALIPIALGVRAAGGLDTPAGYGWTTLGALLAVVIIVNKSLNDMVHVARAASGASRASDDEATTTPRGTGLAKLRRLARFVPFHRLYHSIELTLLILAAAVVDVVTGGLIGTQALLIVLLPASLLTVTGHFVAIISSSRLRA